MEAEDRRSGDMTELVEVLLRRLATENKRPYPAEAARARGTSALREGAALIEAWLYYSGGPPEDLLTQVRERALLATKEQKAAPDDWERECTRRGWWRVTFLLAEALGLDPFGETGEQVRDHLRGQVTAGDWPPRTCAGRRKDGRPCQAIPRRGALFCSQHQQQDMAAAIGGEIDADSEGPGDALDREVATWLADFERARAGRQSP